jgi:hypothetical protein
MVSVVNAQADAQLAVTLAAIMNGVKCRRKQAGDQCRPPPIISEYPSPPRKVSGLFAMANGEQRPISG